MLTFSNMYPRFTKPVCTVWIQFWASLKAMKWALSSAVFIKPWMMNACDGAQQFGKSHCCDVFTFEEGTPTKTEIIFTFRKWVIRWKSWRDNGKSPNKKSTILGQTVNVTITHYKHFFFHLKVFHFCLFSQSNKSTDRLVANFGRGTL